MGFLAPDRVGGTLGRVVFRLSRLFVIVLLAGIAGAGARPTVSIAAAANLTYVLEALNAEFRRTEPEVTLTTTFGASGGLFAQIRHGAPFDIFLSADTEYPTALARSGDGRADTLHTFATGRLVLWTNRADLKLDDLAEALREASVRKVAIANPQAAPYGRAAEAALRCLGAWEAVRPKLVIGESIAQAAQFVETGNADLGIVARSFVISARLAGRGRWLEVPPRLYAKVSLAHACILTRGGASNPAAQRYLTFLLSPRAQSILASSGYAAK